jgi:uncharacterized integral membrane protein
MGSLWLKFKVWSKVVIFAFVTLYLLTFIFRNSDEPAKFWFWFWKPDLETSILYLVLVSFLAGVLLTLLVRTTWTTVRQIREVRQRARTEKLEREVADMKSKAAMLQTRPAATTGASAPLDEHPPTV